jgi:hypothetical protein
MPCSETWTLRRTEKRRLEATEMWFLRYVAGYTVWDKERVDEMSQLGMRKLGIQIHERKKN